MRADVIPQFVAILELSLAHVTGELLLLVAAVYSLMSFQAIQPLVLPAAIGADVVGLHHVRISVNLRHVVVIGEYRGILRFRRV